MSKTMRKEKRENKFKRSPKINKAKQKILNSFLVEEITAKDISRHYLSELMEFHKAIEEDSRKRLKKDDKNKSRFN